MPPIEWLYLWKGQCNGGPGDLLDVRVQSDQRVQLFLISALFHKTRGQGGGVVAVIALVVGAFAAILLSTLTELRWTLVFVFWLGALPFQLVYARRLNYLLGGADPVATFGARNLSELRATIRIPITISLLHFGAKAMFWAGATAAALTFV